MTIYQLQAAANAFLDGAINSQQFNNRLGSALFWPLPDATAIWLAKAIAERDLPANHRLIG